MKENYNKKMLIEIDKIIDNNKKPTLLLHSCCAPCSSYVIEFLSQYFQIEVFFFNPNIYPENEYIKRLEEQIRLIKEMGFNYKVVENKYESNLFYDSIRGYEKMGEGSKRCEKCFMLRLDKTAQYAKLNKFDYFTTTLTISPLKNAELINSIGEELENKYNVKFLNSDFKKNNGYKTSVELSKKYNLYRQNYCGCVFSQQEYVDRMNKKNNI
ncbi:epoxyqueuosine reductase QueH [Clostridium bornimense]|uniref:epoxyqueuosine reductase QueH n=1 Tax=Clostridium bornimense TaxID=1216932 RepID=UPI001C0FB8A0|nr:epoxyqueuosine reductase QueH [Clostridium bornimense]MBU5315725.1 epoxyqueuosine reductase QueH [Clostridium bornimense]